MDEKISVIVPVYNVEQYLSKCIESILKQTYKNIEIILVDDGSTDQSGKMCEKFKEKDDRIKVIHKENGGLSDARNVGIEVAGGQYYSFIDGDDYLENDALESMLEAALSTNSEIAICNIMRFYDDGTTSEFYNPANVKETWTDNKRFDSLNQPSVCNKLFDSKIFENIRFPYGKFYEDTYVYHELLYRANSVALTGKTGYWYLSRKNSILGRPIYTDRYFDFVEAVYQRAKFLVDKQVQPYGDEACLSLYAALANAEKNVEESKENKEKFSKARAYYKEMYDYIMRGNGGCNMKQKVRLIMLRYFPQIHSKVYLR